MKERRKKEEVFLVFPSNPMSYWINAKKKKMITKFYYSTMNERTE
jgi:hypothetical protein